MYMKVNSHDHRHKISETMDLSILQLAFLLLLPLFIFLFFSQIPSKGSRSTSSFLQFIKNRHRFLDWATEIILQTPTHTMILNSPLRVSGIITANPANVEHMLKDNFDNYPKGDRTISMMKDFLGHGIFNSDGEHWKVQRKVASFEFNKKSLRNFVVDTVQREIVDRLLPLLRRASEKNRVLDLQDVLECFGFDNICKVAFGEDPACLGREEAGGKDTSGFMKAFGDAQNLISERFMNGLELTWKIKKLFNIGSEKQLRESISIVHAFSVEIIRSKKQQYSSDQKEDLLSRFASNKENTDEFLRDIVTSFILAGRETTSSALTWFFWIISRRSDVKNKILEEVKSVRTRNGNYSETFSFDELREMHYLHAAISESMRLYPPVPLDTQSCREDDTMPDGTFVGKGWSITYASYAMGRSEEIWGKDCRDYKPERWLENGAFRPESPFKFPIFHAGPRMCLGKEMAYVQMKSIAACVLERFNIDAVMKDKVPEHLLSLTLRMKGGLPIRVREREEL